MLSAIIFIMYIESAFVAFLLNLLTGNFNHDKSFVLTSKTISSLFFSFFLFGATYNRVRSLKGFRFLLRLDFFSHTHTVSSYTFLRAHTHTVHSVTGDKNDLRTLSLSLVSSLYLSQNTTSERNRSVNTLLLI